MQCTDIIIAYLVIALAFHPYKFNCFPYTLHIQTGYCPLMLALLLTVSESCSSCGSPPQAFAHCAERSSLPRMTSAFVCRESELHSSPDNKKQDTEQGACASIKKNLNHHLYM